ncbi:FAD-dependent oxidoreductase [Bacillus kwashiorkori]|uniref:FAD-dependent oxidoreductase n=1 Tax=Bacillus kwashiorkori TaxID=1522318 RepID=UPI00078581EC|nr:FAD-dependent oxidoreductase [Bacillus kwashiorkori]
MNKSLPKETKPYWLDSVELPTFPSLNDDLTCDVAIIGGGISGIMTAYLLMESGIKVALLEADTLLSGTTGHTTAKLTAQHGLFYDELIQHFGIEKAKQYYDSNQQAIEFVKTIVKKYQIKCDLTEEAATIYTQDTQNVTKLEKEMEAYTKLQIPGRLTETTPLPFHIKQAIIMDKQYQFHPLKFLKVIVEKLKESNCLIYEKTVASKVEMGNQPKVLLKNGKAVVCDYVVSCSHFPFHDEGFYFARMYPERSYVVAALTNTDFPGGMYINAEQPTRSIRYTPYKEGKLVLFSGEHHKTGQGVDTYKHYENLQQFAENTFGVQSIIYRWSAQDYSTLDKVPYVGYVTNSNRNILVATGFRKWGMTNSISAAHLLADLIMNRDNLYVDLYTPSRFQTDPSVKRFLQTNIDVAKQLIGGKLEKLSKTVEDLNNNEGAVIDWNGQRAGGYKDGKGKLFVVDSTCTHMGCELEWNSGERTWDCPCHGSRFSIKGEVVEGPAETPLKLLNQ